MWRKAYIKVKKKSSHLKFFLKHENNFFLDGKDHEHILRKILFVFWIDNKILWSFPFKITFLFNIGKQRITIKENGL